MIIKLLGLSLIGCLCLSGCANKLAVGSYNVVKVKDEVSLVDCKTNQKNEINYNVDTELSNYLINDLSFMDYKTIENYKANIDICKIDKDYVNLNINESFKFNNEDNNIQSNGVLKLEKCSNELKPYQIEFKKDINLIDKYVSNQINSNDLPTLSESNNFKNETKETLVHVVYDSYKRLINVCLEDNGKIKIDGHLLFHKVKPIIE